MPRDKVLIDLYNNHQNYLAPVSIERQPFDSSRFEQVISSFFCPGPHYYYIIDSPTLTFETVSPGAQTILGIDLKGKKLYDLLELFHPDDIDFVLKCEDYVADFIRNKIDQDKITNYKISYCVREKVANGGYRLFLIQTITLQTTPGGSLVKVLGIHTDISHITPTNNYKISFTGLNGEPSYLGINMLEDAPKLADHHLTHPFTYRELEVIKLLTQGFTAKEIADKTNVSTETIITHKKNTIKKAGVKNSVELVAYCLRNGLI